MTGSAQKRVPFGWKEMEQDVFEEMSRYIYSHCRIKLPPIKRTMLSSRISKRIRVTGFTGYREYFEYIKTLPDNDPEIMLMIDAVTTNKTDFFRENSHFDYLCENVLPSAGNSQFRVWSAGCSSGEEVYTLAMVMEEFYRERHTLLYSVLGTDIATDMLQKGLNAVYREQDIKPIRADLKKKYFLRGTGSKEGFYRVVPELRKKVEFCRFNLINAGDWRFNHLFDVIFCRNVVIYFDKATQKELFARFYEQLKPGGYLFIGHSETLHGINTDFIPAGISVYRKAASGERNPGRRMRG